MNNFFKPVILGISGFYLSKKEYFLFRKHKPLGYVIFTRNIANLTQLKNLVSELRSINPEQKTLIMIDHEGGRVNRFHNLFDQSHYSAKIFGNYYQTNKKLFNQEIKKFINFNCNLFKYLGINLVAAPVLDLFYRGKSDVIGDRAYSNKVEIVKDIANKIIKLYFKKKIFTIGKHVPGHGLSNHDSHFFLPVIKESKEYLFKNDFRCFKNIKSNFLMTAHIIYENLDKNLPATYSSLIIKNIIMSKLKFRGLIMSDDLCMKALSGSIEKKVSKSFEAGCDIILHCSGNFHEMNKLLIVTKFASDSLLAKMNKMFNYNQ